MNWGESSLYFKLFLVVSSSSTHTPPVCCCNTLSMCPDAPGAKGWEKFHWACLGLAPLPHLWALLTGSACIILFIFCCFWLAPQWEKAPVNCCAMGVLGVCASAGSLARHWPLGFKWRTQLCSTGVMHSSFEGLGLSWEISEHENLNCDFTCTSGYFSWRSECFKCKMDYSKFIHLRLCTGEDFLFLAATVSNSFLAKEVCLSSLVAQILHFLW